MVTVAGRAGLDRWLLAVLTQGGQGRPQAARWGSLDGPVRYGRDNGGAEPVGLGWWRRPVDALRCCLQDPLGAGVKQAELGCLVMSSPITDTWPGSSMERFGAASRTQSLMTTRQWAHADTALLLAASELSPPCGGEAADLAVPQPVVHQGEKSPAGGHLGDVASPAGRDAVVGDLEVTAGVVLGGRLDRRPPQ